MKGMLLNAELWGAQAASLHRPAACRAEVQRTNFETKYRVHTFRNVFGKLPKTAGWEPALPGVVK